MFSSPSLARAAVRRVLILTAVVAALGIALGACSPAASPSPSPTPVTSPTPGAGAIVLDRAPADTACDTIGIDYTSFTFRIDPDGNPQVWAVTNDGTVLQVKWDPSFTGGDAGNPVVMDKDGTVVAEDGTEVEIPDAAYPELEGHFVCTGPTSLTILDQAPS
ncbi:MAG TPA: hypothetical protein VFX65_14005 [Candidatus Limnocylindrales bacterium]|nr:hypothetical protein [Candidatus Limnocylindrales bacterium]